MTYTTTQSFFPVGLDAHKENERFGGVLEALVDVFGAAVVVSRLAEVFGDKAAHLEESWQDTASAKGWRAAALKLDTVAVKHMGTLPTSPRNK